MLRPEDRTGKRRGKEMLWVDQPSLPSINYLTATPGTRNTES